MVFHFANKDLYSQSYGFSCSHVRIWELDHKEGWAPKNWCFWTMELETLGSLLASKEIKPVNPKGNQPWIFIGRTDQFSSVQSLSCVQLFVTPWTAAHQASLSITNSQSLLKFMSTELVMPSQPLLSPSPPAFNLSQQGSFQMSQLFASGGQSFTGVSASTSVLRMNT